MSLRTYRQKREFSKTPEPAGKAAPRRKGNSFVVQKHDASRLHYDFRLELDGVMLSWAVTRGPSLVPDDKRLAVHVEDHPIEYNKFEGTIPKGQYGGGTVMIWDRGKWFPEGDPQFGYKKGHLAFRLEGEKLKGNWHLVRMRKRDGERQDPWLLMKVDDEEARSRRDPDILEEEPLSVATGRSMEQIAAGEGGKRVWQSNRAPKAAAAKPKTVAPAPRARERKPRAAAKGKRTATKKAKRKATKGRLRLTGAVAAPLPEFVTPCLTTPSEKAPNTANWVHEIKFDGYRIQARVEGGKARLLTRKGLDWTERFRGVAEAVAALPVDDALLDGEIVVLGNGELSSFSALQEALKSGNGTFLYFVFDLLHWNGMNLLETPLMERKQALQEILADEPEGGIVKLSEHFETEGSVLLKHACEMGLEGIISKLRDAPYRPGRTGDWLKVKCGGRQEFVIIGYALATNDPHAIGALIVGYYEDGVLRYAGRVGTGYTRETSRDLWKKLDPLRLKAAPVKPIPVEERGSRKPIWVKPRLVAEVNFRGWTHGKRLRHPSFEGLRDDKSATDVVREDAPTMAKSAQSRGRGAKAPAAPKKAAAGASARARASGNEARPAAGKEAVAGEVRLTHPDRVYWEDVGLTKRDLADYYTKIWDWIAPHVTGRVLSLVRCPEGTSQQCFFQKHASAGLEEKWLHMVPEDGDKVIAIDDLNGLIALVQAATLEIHVRGSTIDKLGGANRVVFDLDPAPDVPWEDVKAAARDARERLAALELESFLKTTGGKGLHVVVPIDYADWEDVKAFAQAVAMTMAEDSPSRYVAVASKAKRAGKVFVDYLRNSHEATAICAYSTRARAGATVSVPIAWSELGSLKVPNHYTVTNLPQRLARMKRDPWADISKVRQRLPRGK